MSPARAHTRRPTQERKAAVTSTRLPDRRSEIGQALWASSHSSEQLHGSQAAPSEEGKFACTQAGGRHLSASPQLHTTSCRSAGMSRSAGLLLSTTARSTASWWSSQMLLIRTGCDLPAAAGSPMQLSVILQMPCRVTHTSSTRLSGWVFFVEPLLLQALIDRPDEVRRPINFKRLALTDYKIEIPRQAKKSVLSKALEESGTPRLELYSSCWRAPAAQVFGNKWLAV